MQEAFLKAYRAIGQFRREARFSTWLYGIVVNQARNRLGRFKRYTTYEGFVNDQMSELEDDCRCCAMAAGADSALDCLEQAERNSAVQTCIRGLETDYREVLILRDIQDLAYEDIQTILTIPPGTVKSTVVPGTTGAEGLSGKNIGRRPMTCGDIQNQLPAYEEGLLSPEENEAVASHLVSCRSCRKALEDLKKAHLLVRGLKEVEPPPGFKQAVMKRIRQETKQKQRFWRKFFFPLYIKIPVQAFVVIVISVLAFYVYRQDAPQLREQGMPLPATPAWESAPHKEPAPLQRQKGNSSPVTGMGDDVAIQLQKKDEALPESVPPVPFSSSAEIVPAQSDMDKTVRENENGTPTFLGEGAATSTGVEQKGFATATKRKDAAEVLSRALPSEKNQVCESDVCRTDNGVEKEANPVPLQSAAMPEQRVSPGACPESEGYRYRTVGFAGSDPKVRHHSDKSFCRGRENHILHQDPGVETRSILDPTA